MTTNNPDIDWVAHTQEEYEEADEPPESLKRIPSSNFRRTTIRRPSEQSSLLTKAIMGHSDDDLHVQHHEIARPILTNNYRRRSMNSNISIASTADLTSDTGLTSPSRPNTPSPPLPEMSVIRLNGDAEPKPVSLLGAAVRQQNHVEVQKEAPRKRCIQFACAKPVVQEPPRPQPMVRTPSAQEAPRRPCIKFACPARPSSTQNTPPRESMAQPARNPRAVSPSTPKRTSLLSASLTPRQPGFRRHSVTRPLFLRADSKDMNSDGSQFHEFASGMAREDDWIRRDSSAIGKKLTIDDTLTKENHIRRLALEAEEEEEAENEEAEAALDDDDEDEDDVDADLDDEDEDDDEYDEDDDEDDEDDNSDGYHTDEETGFADSDDEDDDDENMAMWTPSQKTLQNTGSIIRRPSLHEQQSDSSIATLGSQHSPRRIKTRRHKSQSETPDLPDSTDFVCGTLDEDRPLEEAYLTCLAARRNEKLRLIPQDIDPSFPASDPDNDDEEEIFNPVRHESDEEEWMHGEMEDLHHGQDRRRRKSEQASPKRLRSPPPAKRRHSPPPPKTRGRSPKPLFDRHSPRKMKSPCRKPMTTPLGSPRCGQVKFNLAGRPGLTHTKSLPRVGAGLVLGQLKHNRRQKVREDDDLHVRGAIDIVKGLERKRQRRKEKFHQKYCNRARRGQIPERKPLPGLGTERMRELGLIMAGKKDTGNYVLSI